MSKKKSEYKVGYCNPPKHTQFKKGQSGNPEGRPKKPKDILGIFEEVLNDEIKIKIDGERISVSNIEAYFRSLMHGAISLKPSAVKELSKLLVLHQKEAQKSADGTTGTAEKTAEEREAERRAQEEIEKIISELTEAKRNELD